MTYLTATNQWNSSIGWSPEETTGSRLSVVPEKVISLPLLHTQAKHLYIEQSLTKAESQEGKDTGCI